MSVSYESAFARVHALVEDFKAHEQAYRASTYTEVELRQDFLDKFLAALGWDVAHEVQKDPFQQEVKVERNVRVGLAKRRADYAFYLAPNFKDVRFFVEAKKPSSEIASPANYFQATRYGWNSQTPLVVLTTFADFHVLDCRYKPSLDPAPGVAVLRFHYSEYTDPEKFPKIYYLFSREAVADGSLERFAEQLPKRKGRAVQRTLFRVGDQRIDEVFLEELDEYRRDLALSLKRTNQDLDGDSLTEITQRILDRLVFIRFLEDKGIEPDPIVESFGRTHSAWADFVSACRRLNGIYNGIVFKEHPLIESASLKVDASVFATICFQLSSASSPYDFNSIPIHILGSIYERFLGKVIEATSRKAEVVEKPAVRRSGGVYYTPEYIVRYMVEKTVGVVIRGKAPGHIAAMHFADIACGSGSFLLGVYDYLIRYHAEWYNAHPGKARKMDIVKHEDGTLHVSLAKKREILVNNIFGVDLDHQAVEVAQLSLYLKLLEEESAVTAHAHQLEFHETLLPSLNKNIQNGNSLISTDILDSSLFAGVDEHKLNPLSFPDAFPAIRDAGGFDVVLGNPPYIRMEAFKALKAYLADHYQVHEERADIYAYMLERALRLLKLGGMLGMIVSNKFMKAKYGRPLRKLFSQLADLGDYVDLAGADVFQGTTVRTAVLVARRADGQKMSKVRYVPVPKKEDVSRLAVGAVSLQELQKATGREVAAKALSVEGWRIVDDTASDLLARLTSEFEPLSAVLGIEPLFGLKTGLNEAFIIDEQTRTELIRKDRKSKEVIRPILFGRDIRRYAIRWGGQYVIYLHPDKKVTDYPGVKAHLSQFKGRLTERAASQAWYELQQPAVGLLDVNEKPKIVYPIIANECRFCLDPDGFLINDKAFVLPTDDLAVLVILNSALAGYYFSVVCAALEGEGDSYLEFRAQYVRNLPVPFLRRADVRVTELRKLGRQILDVAGKAQGARTEREREYLTRRQDSLVTQTDDLVNDLYRLSAEEVSVIDGDRERL
jgi:type I restriction-modification system DNA methylase subunit